MAAPKWSNFREITPQRADEFLRKGHKRRHFFPHRIYHMRNRLFFLSMAAAILIFSLLYLLAISPYWKITPDSSTYVMAGESIAAGHGYKVMGKPAPLFPPMTSLIFGLCLWLFPGSYFALNATIAILTLSSLILTFILFKNDTGTPQALILVLMSLGSALLFLHSTFLLSDIIYLFFSLLALITIKSFLNKDSAWRNQVVMGLILLAACMTRIVGLALIVAMILYALVSWLTHRATPTRLVMIMLFIVIFMVSLWEYRSLRRLGHSTVKVFLQNEPWVDEAGYTSVPGFVSRFFRNAHRYEWIGTILTNGTLNRSGNAQKYLSIVAISFFLLGLFVSLKNFPSVLGIYTAIYLSLIAAFEADAGARYFVAVLPFLFYYSFLGLRFVQKQAKFVTGAAVSGLISAGVFCYLVGYLASGFIYIVEAIPEQHKSIFNAYPIKYTYNYDTQRLAMWLKDHSVHGEAYVTQHASMIDIMTQRRGYNFPFSENQEKLLTWLHNRRITYVLADKKKLEVQKYLLPVIKAHPDKFTLVRDEKEASLYRFNLNQH